MFNVDFQRIESVHARTSDLIAAWVFVSGQTGHVGPSSDLDIALFFGEKPSLDRLADLRATLQEALHFDDIDLVILNQASPITRFEAVSGRPVYTRDASARAGFVSLTAREYEDGMAFLQQGLRYRAAAKS
jgi:predicted nucleotidyltransferase